MAASGRPSKNSITPNGVSTFAGEPNETTTSGGTPGLNPGSNTTVLLTWRSYPYCLIPGPSGLVRTNVLRRPHRLGCDPPLPRQVAHTEAPHSCEQVSRHEGVPTRRLRGRYWGHEICHSKHGRAAHSRYVAQRRGPTYGSPSAVVGRGGRRRDGLIRAVHATGSGLRLRPLRPTILVSVGRSFGGGGDGQVAERPSKDPKGTLMVPSDDSSRGSSLWMEAKRLADAVAVTFRAGMGGRRPGWRGIRAT